MGSEGDVSGGRWRRLGPDAGERRRRGRANEPYPTEFGIAHRELSRATSAGLKARHEAARVNRQSSPSSSPGDDCCAALACLLPRAKRSEEHTSELQSLMRISYAVFCLKKKNT